MQFLKENYFIQAYNIKWNICVQYEVIIYDYGW